MAVSAMRFPIPRGYSIFFAIFFGEIFSKSLSDDIIYYIVSNIIKKPLVKGACHPESAFLLQKKERQPQSSSL